jgi:hypothetical protein
VAYALNTSTGSDKSVKILNTTNATVVTLTNLLAGTAYKVSILPVVTATEAVGSPATVDFTTLKLTANVAGKRAKAKAGKLAKAKAKATPNGR